MPPAGNIPPQPYLTLDHISRCFGSVLANQDISLDFFEGEIHAIVGENGAGKSTLMKILNGELQPDSGEIRMSGSRVTFPRPQDAMLAGIGMAHQNFLIFPQLTALENVITGLEPCAGIWLRSKQAKAELLELCRSVGFDLPLDSPASQLSFAHRQQIEILRLLHRKVKVLILDEPTSLLAPPETERVLNLLQALQSSGHTILFISHRLHEVYAIAHRVSVLSRGRLAGSYPISEITVDRLVQLVISGEGGTPGSPSDAGSPPTSEHPDPLKIHHPPGKQLPASSEDHLQEAQVPPQHSELRSQHDIPSLLELNEITTRPGSREGHLHDFSLRLFEGEIFGLGGVVGNGQHQLALVLAGLIPVGGGSIFLSGEEITQLPTSDRVAKGLRWLPANPTEEALLPSRSLWENLLLGRHRDQPYQQQGWLNRMAISSWAADQLKLHQVVFGSLTDPLDSLSGGNLQKLALSRVLEGLPRLIVLEQPSRGLDLRAQELMRKRVLELKDQGVSFVLISYDLDELLALCHRIGVLYRGRLMGIAESGEASLDLLGSWMLGLDSEA